MVYGGNYRKNDLVEDIIFFRSYVMMSFGFVRVFIRLFLYRKFKER